MQLTGKEILEKNIIKGSLKEEQLQQQGIDLTVKSIKSIGSPIGIIPLQGKTTTPMTSELPETLTYSGEDCLRSYELQPGYYEVIFNEGCEIPNNMSLHIKGRSSLVRCGGMVNAGQWDAGFRTESMGCYLFCFRPLVIEKGARLAQAIVFMSNEVENLYDGQYQGK